MKKGDNTVTALIKSLILQTVIHMRNSVHASTTCKVKHPSNCRIRAFSCKGLSVKHLEQWSPNLTGFINDKNNKDINSAKCSAWIQRSVHGELFAGLDL